MDFYRIAERSTTKGRDKEVIAIDIYPDFLVKRSSDLMIRGKSFYAIWDKEKKAWSRDEYDVAALVDKDLYEYKDVLSKNTKTENVPVKVASMASSRSKTWKEYKQYITSLADNFHPLDENLTFLNTEVKKEDYVSKRLNYALEEGDFEAWDKLVGTLYEPGEREKIEWAIGAVVSGDSKVIQKFCVFYGAAGTGKSTIINIIQKLFDGYYVTFDAKALATANSQFSTEMFRSNPLVAIQHDGDLSRIEDNTKLNSIVSHEEMVINEKGKPQYTMRTNCFMFLGTNKPVKITDGYSGILRRLIDIHPTGKKIPKKEYEALMSRIDFELGAIAYHCLDVYRSLGKNYYNKYRPRDMIVKTNVFFNYILSEDFQDALDLQDGMTLKEAYKIYLKYCDETKIKEPMPRYRFAEELKIYFERFDEITRVDGRQVRSWYSGFKREKLEPPVLSREEKSLPLVLDSSTSLLDDILADCQAQYATTDSAEKPITYWANCETALKDIDTTKLHYVLPQSRFKSPALVMIDFDIKDSSGQKSMLLNLEAASKWPATYAEFSKGGHGVHLIYWYSDDISKVASVYSPGIEIKTFLGNSAMRRRLSKCNNVPIATLPLGALPLKEEKVIDIHELKDQQHLVNKIRKSLRKDDNVGGTKCEIDFIKKTLDDAYASGMHYDVSDMEDDILKFAMHSTNHKDYCVKQIYKMKFMSRDEEERGRKQETRERGRWPDDMPITFFDIEIYRPTEPGELDADGEENEGLFLICWKNAGDNEEIHAEVNPTPETVEELFKKKQAGFNNRDYDNHMEYARSLGYSNARLYDLSQRIIVEKARDAKFPEAFDISYTDVYDFCAKKQGLKKWEIELGIDHIEMDIPWDKPAPKSKWDEIIKYCKNDVLATEAVFNANRGDFIAREILADISGGTVNDKTNTLTTKFIFNGDPHPKLVYTDLSKDFPGYEYVPAFKSSDGERHNMYRGVDLGFGGYSYSEPGIYSNVALIDIQSMHPSSMVAMNYFGDYTQRFKDILDTRIAIKTGNLDKARSMFGGALKGYLNDASNADALAQALKIAINSCYGLTSASFPNAMRDERNVNNIVALRGALFMKTLLDELQHKGITVMHLKVDSMKIPNATPEIIDFCMKFANQYGYNFEHEATYERICLLDKAQYVAAYMDPDECEKRYGYIPSDNRKHFKKHNHPWTTTGDAFQHPYIFKKLFSGEIPSFRDMCETKTVKDAAIYLDLNEGLKDVSLAEIELEKRMYNETHEKQKKLSSEFSGFSDDDLISYISEGHQYQFVGRAGAFFPVRSGVGGGWMYALRNGKYSSISGTKGYRWLEANTARGRHLEDDYDSGYFDKLIGDAIKAVNSLGSSDPERFERFIDISKPYNEKETGPSESDVPWVEVPCGDQKYNTCMECPCYKGEDICSRGYSLASYFENELPF